MSLKVIGALWQKEGKKGNYLAGTLDLGVLGKKQIAVFQNEREPGEEGNKPTARICLFEDE